MLEVLERWDRRLETAAAAWAELSAPEQERREARLDAGGPTDEWVVVLWNWWNEAPLAAQAQLRSDVTVLAQALWAAAADGRLASRPMRRSRPGTCCGRSTGWGRSSAPAEVDRDLP